MYVYMYDPPIILLINQIENHVQNDIFNVLCTRKSFEVRYIDMSYTFRKNLEYLVIHKDILKINVKIHIPGHINYDSRQMKNKQNKEVIKYQSDDSINEGHAGCYQHLQSHIIIFQGIGLYYISLFHLTNSHVNCVYYVHSDTFLSPYHQKRIFSPTSSQHNKVNDTRDAGPMCFYGNAELPYF